MVLPNRNGIEGKREEERIDSIFIKKMLSRQLEIGRELDRVGIGRRERGRDGGKEGRAASEEGHSRPSEHNCVKSSVSGMGMG